MPQCSLIVGATVLSLYFSRHHIQYLLTTLAATRLGSVSSMQHGRTYGNAAQQCGGNAATTHNICRLHARQRGSAVSAACNTEATTHNTCRPHVRQRGFAVSAACYTAATTHNTCRPHVRQRGSAASAACYTAASAVTLHGSVSSVSSVSHSM